mgnify:FL=1
MNSRLLGKAMQTERLLYIDVLKSMAILFMVEVHTSAQLAPSNIPRDSVLALIAASIGGLAAPLFVTLSGWSMQHSLIQKKRMKGDYSLISYWLITRFSFLFVCQFVVNLIANHVFNWNTPGILTLLAICTLIGIPLSKIKMKSKLLLFLLLCITPLCNNFFFEMRGDWEFLINVNSPIDFFERILINGTYPLFPWAAFFVLGSILRDSNTLLNKKMLFCGLMLSSSFIFYSIIFEEVWALTQGNALLTFFPASIGFIITANSVVLILFMLFKKFNSKFESSVTAHGFAKIGKLTLTIYLLHFIPLRIFNDLSLGELNLSTAFGITILFTLCWWPFSIIHEKWFKKYSLESLIRYILAKKNIQPTIVRDS